MLFLVGYGQGAEKVKIQGFAELVSDHSSKGLGMGWGKKRKKRRLRIVTNPTISLWIRADPVEVWGFI